MTLHEIAYLVFALNKHIQNCGSDAPDRAFCAEIACVEPRQIYAPQPVYLAAGKTCGIEVIVFACRFKVSEPGTDTRLRHGGDPQAAHRFCTADVVVYVSENALALTSGVCCFDNLVDFGTVHLPGKRFQD